MLLKPEGLHGFGPYRLDARERRLLRNGEAIPLPPKAFDLLLVLVARAGSLITKEELLAEVWAGTFVEEANLPYTISLLRKALGEDEHYIETVPKQGYRFIARVSFVSNNVADGAAQGRTKAAVRRGRWPIAAACVVLLAAGSWILWRTNLLSSRNHDAMTTVPVTSFGGFARMPRLSPDGRRVVYQWDGRRKEDDLPNWDVYVQSVEGSDPLPLTSSPASERFPVWSPDGERIAFVTSIGGDRYAIHMKPALGGAEQPITPPDVYPAPRPIDWSPGGNTLAFTLQPDRPGAAPIALLSLSSGQVTILTSPPPGVVVDRVPRFSPDGRTIAFIRDSTDVGPYGDLYTIDLAGGRERQITSGSRAIQGEDWTADGRELVFSSDRAGPWTLWRIAADASEVEPRPVAGVGTGAFFPSVAARADRLVYHEERLDNDIWRTSMSLAHDGVGGSLGGADAVLSSTRMDASPQVSPDGQHLVFVSRRSGDQGIWISDMNGSNAVEIASFPGYPSGAPRWSPTGTRVAFDASVRGPAEIYVVARQGGTPQRLTSELAENVVPSWSRDEKWIYFSSDRTGREEVWKVLSSGGGATQVTRDGGFAPIESRDGFLYYVKPLGRGGIWRVPVGGGEEAYVLEGPTPGYWGYWALLSDGICFATQEANSRAPASVQYFDFHTQQTTVLGHIDAPAIQGTPGFGVSPDGKSLFYVKPKPTTSDIMLVKNFR